MAKILALALLAPLLLLHGVFGDEEGLAEVGSCLGAGWREEFGRSVIFKKSFATCFFDKGRQGGTEERRLRSAYPGSLCF